MKMEALEVTTTSGVVMVVDPTHGAMVVATEEEGFEVADEVVGDPPMECQKRTFR